MIRAAYVTSLDPKKLLDPRAAGWRGARAVSLDLMGTSLGLQPTAAIRVSWTGKKIGAIERVKVRAVHDGRFLAFGLEWKDPSEDRVVSDSTDFSDAAAVLLPSSPHSPLVTMGAPQKPVTAWYWRADDEDGRGRHVVAEGLGTTRTVDRELVRVHGDWREGRWRVVIARALRVRTEEPVAQLAAGQKTRFGVALWEGSHRERAGIKAFSGDWRELALEPVPAAGR